MKRIFLSIILLAATASFTQAQRLRDYGITYGIFKTGENNAITDVKEVKIGRAHV